MSAERIIWLNKDEAFKGVHTQYQNQEWLDTDRTHEECNDCALLFIMPAACDGHLDGAVSYPDFRPQKDGDVIVRHSQVVFIKK